MNDIAISEELRGKLRQVTTATLSIQLLKRGIRSVYLSGIVRVTGESERLVGPAYTLSFLPFREDLFDPARIGNPESNQRRAIEEAPEGSVLVIGTGGTADNGTIGDILAARLQVRGVAGVVTDGAVRDLEGISALNFPVFAAGAAAPATYNGFSEGLLNLPIACGGVAVHPGDIIVADGDGAVLVPRVLAEELAEAGVEQERLERFLAMRVRSGAPSRGTYPPSEETRAAYRAWVEAGEPDEL